MPSNIRPANPTVVMPFGLASAFTEESRYEALVNAYPDGSSDRKTLVTNPRRRFSIQRPLTAAKWSELRSFYFAHLIDPFYFYNLRETVPPFSFDPSGGSPVGRYTVVWDSGWSEELRLGRSSASFAVREVA